MRFIYLVSPQTYKKQTIYKSFRVLRRSKCTKSTPVHLKTHLAIEQIR